MTVPYPPVLDCLERGAPVRLAAEAANFVRNSNAVELLVVHRDPSTVRNATDAEELEGAGK